MQQARGNIRMTRGDTRTGHTGTGHTGTGHTGVGLAVWHWAVLGVGFLLAFAIPLSGALHVGGLLQFPWQFFPWSKSSSEVSKELFSEPFVISSQGSYVSLEGGLVANPSKSAPFLLTVWMNLKRLPSPGEQLVLLSKYEGTPLPNNGYAIALKRDDVSLRPMVFWGDEGTTGKWYDFPAIDINSRDWFLLALSFSEQRYLGLYLGAAESTNGPSQGASLKLLGGYELGTTVIPSSSAPLILGAARERHFRGMIGPFGAFLGPLQADTRKVLGELVKTPEKLPTPLKEVISSVWIPKASYTSGTSPEGDFRVSFESGSPARGNRRKQALSNSDRDTDGKKV